LGNKLHVDIRSFSRDTEWTLKTFWAKQFSRYAAHKSERLSVSEKILNETLGEGGDIN